MRGGESSRRSRSRDPDAFPAGPEPHHASVSLDCLSPTTSSPPVPRRLFGPTTAIGAADCLEHTTPDGTTNRRRASVRRDGLGRPSLRLSTKVLIIRSLAALQTGALGIASQQTTYHLKSSSISSHPRVCCTTNLSFPISCHSPAIPASLHLLSLLQSSIKNMLSSRMRGM